MKLHKNNQVKCNTTWTSWIMHMSKCSEMKHIKLNNIKKVTTNFQLHMFNHIHYHRLLLVQRPIIKIYIYTHTHTRADRYIDIWSYLDCQARAINLPNNARSDLWAGVQGHQTYEYENNCGNILPTAKQPSSRGSVADRREHCPTVHR
jgi:hypothetical protein